MTRRLPVTLLAVAAMVCGCGSSSAPTRVREVPEGAAVTLVHGDARVGTYVSKPWGFSTSTYWIEGPTGLILIDTQFLPSAAEEAVDWAERATRKKVELAIVLHPNPDKFNGTLALRRRGIKVVTSEQVRALIPAVHEKRKGWFYDRYKPDYPVEVPLPEAFGAATRELSAGGITVKAHVLGAGCSEAHVVVQLDKHLFVGDLVANGSHSWLEIGRTDEWLRRLAELEKLEPDHVHPGRGPSAGGELLEREEAYLRRVITIVAAEKPTLPASDEALARVQAKIEEEYPGYGYSVFLKIGLPAEWERQARAR
jgi:glyoxylase-like metal-dependent hydrolase (beta-lactamase superfamily II)